MVLVFHVLRGVVVLVLSLNASQALALVVPEPCSAIEAADVDDRSCPPTCVRCGCCAQPAEATVFYLSADVSPVVPATPATLKDILLSISRDIFHVPKR
jgi:hypothetical protein